MQLWSALLSRLSFGIRLNVNGEDWPLMTRLQQAEQQLQDALRALESAVESVMKPDPADLGAVERANLISEIAAIEARLGEAMAFVSAADNAGDGGGA